jgi:hypothetical protein
MRKPLPGGGFKNGSKAPALQISAKNRGRNKKAAEGCREREVDFYKRDYTSGLLPKEGQVYGEDSQVAAADGVR